jgi:hypothetical protein
MKIPDEFDSAAASVAGGPATNDPLDKAAAGVVQGQRTALRSSLYGALMANPDMAARAQKLGRQTGLPADVVERNLPEVQRTAQLDEFDQVLKNSPTVAQWLMDQNNAKVAHDDVGNMSAVESALRYLVSAPGQEKGLLRDIGATAFTSGRMLTGLARAGVETLAIPEDAINNLTGAGAGPLRRYADELGRSGTYLGQRARETASQWAPNSTMQQIFGGGATSGVQSAIQSLGTGVAASWLLGPEVGIPVTLGALAFGQGGESYQKAREKGAGHLQSLAYGAEDATAEYVGEKYFGVAGFLKNAMTGASAKKLLAYELSKEMPGEMGTTLWQNFNEWANLNPDKPVGEFIKEQPAALAQTMVATLVGGGAQIGVVKGLESIGANTRQQVQIAQDAEQNASVLDKLRELATASKVRERDPATFQQFVEQASQDGPVQDVYIDAKTFAQAATDAGLTPEQLPPSVAAQLESALVSGGSLRIPVGEFAAQIAPTEYAQGLMDHIKTDPQGMTRAEAKVYMQSYGEELKAQVEKLIEDKGHDLAFNHSIAQVKATFHDQLNTANRFTPEVNNAYASMLSNFYGVQSAKLGITPEALMERYPLRIQAEGVQSAASQYDQDGGLITDSENFRNWYGDWQNSPGGAINGTQGHDNGGGGKSLDSVQRPGNLETNSAAPGRVGDYEFSGATGPTGKDGKPAIFYHGTKDDITAFDTGHGNRHDLGWLGRGVYTTSSSDLADTYASVKRGDNGYRGDENIMPVYVSVRNPYVATVETKKALKNASQEQIDQFTQQLKDQGHDGVVMEFSDGHVELMAFEPSQIKSVFNRGTFDPSDPNILHQSAPEQIDSPGFELWSHGNPVVKIDEGHTFKSGEGVVVEALHGTTGDFDTFQQDKANIESDLGGGFYFTNTIGDVGENYAGLGPDLTNKVERLAEQIASETDREYDDPDVVAEARSQFMANEGFTMPVFVRFDNPAVIGGSGETFLDYEEPYDDENDEYGEPQGKLVDFVEALRDAASEYSDADADAAMADVLESASDGGIGAGDLIAKLKASEGLMYATDDNGVSASSEIIRKAFAGAGFDGFIDTTVNQKFGSEKRVGKAMAGMDGETVHFIAFNANQVASRIGSTWTRTNVGDSILKQGTGNRGQIAFGSDITQQASVITLLKNADLSTFLHEAGHFFLEVQFDLAARIAGEAALFGDDTNKPGEQQVLADTSELMRWFGVNSIEEWFGLPEEQKRSYHEQFARGFEAYLFEGKAPSIELQGIFQRFRAWMLKVYKDLKNLNVELTDEVRAVMDRMLATTEQIQLAEQGRSMMPLFTSAQQAGMTTEEFADYQALGMDATQSAVEDLQARNLRDMQWMANAKGREVKKLQKESAARRAEMMIEARREIMSQPVYRAWQFLTGKLSKDDKAAVAPDPVPKSTNGPVDPAVDSLFVAIAKLGGLDRDQVRSQWGLFKDERSPQPLFGKPLLRKTDGLGLDAMGEALAEEGYLPKDEHGKFDPADLEAKFDAEYRGDTQYSMAFEYSAASNGEKLAGQDADLENLGAGRIDLRAAKDLGIPDEIVEHIVNLKMTAKDGIDPDLLAEQFGFTSGDELVRSLAATEAPKVAIEALTDQKMLERYGELSSPEAIARAADAAIHNDVRSRFVAAELNALAKATGKPKVLASAAREYAKAMIDRLLVRNIKPTQYAMAEARAAKASEKASKSGDLEQAAVEKRNQLISSYATKAAYDAQAEMEKALRYLAKFERVGTRKSIDTDYLDQIDSILERFDLRTGQSLKSIDKRKALADWIGAQEELGIEVELPEKIRAEAFRQSYKDLTVEEMRGLVDSIKQIEHLGRLKEKLLTAADNRRFADIVASMVASIEEHAGDKRANNRTRDTLGNHALRLFNGFVASHRKTASLARELDGFQDAGPMWTYLIQSMNTAGDREATMRAEATTRLAEMLKPVLAEGRMGKKQLIAEIGDSLTRGEQIVVALNMGNAGNMQRLADGRMWTGEQIGAVVKNLSSADWQFVQKVWDFFESYRPQMAAKERRVMGKEPNWVEPQALTVYPKDGGIPVTLRGGYFPIVYDSRESGRAERQADAEAAKQMMKGAFVASTTRRSFIKTRAEEVSGRPLLLTWDALFRSANDVIHDLAWHEWVIDANRIVKNDQVDKAIRNTYGADVIQQFKAAIRDVAAGDAPNMDALSPVLTPLRTGAAVAGLGLNIMNAMLQPLGLTQSMVRVGPKWVAMGIAEWAKSPIELVTRVNEKSEFMRNRSRTQNRELNEIQSVVKGKSNGRAKIDAFMFLPMQSLQLIADMPTWWGAYQKALAQAPVDMADEVSEELAIKLADQAVIDAQGGGQVKDLALIQRGGSMQKLFTVFYGFFSTAYNLGVERAKETNYRDPLEVMRLAGDFLLLYSVPAVLSSLLKDALTPGGGDDPEKLARKLIGEQISYLMGLMVGVRELTGMVQYATGTKQFDTSYGGPAGLRFFQEVEKFAKQVNQGELDRALARSLVNVGGIVLKLPSAQFNRSVDGYLALKEGKTDNPAALLFGYDKGK